MTDYMKLRVIELRDLLTKRSLPTNGVKSELVARLQAADKAPAASEPAAASNDDHVYDDETPAPATAANLPASAAAAAVDGDGKPKRKTLASLFDNKPAKPAEPSSPSTVTDEATPVTASKPATSAAKFAANLPSTSLDDEIARRKKRAERFGLTAQEDEALKKLERQKRFGLERVAAIDNALPEERKRKGAEGVAGDGKRARQQQQGHGGRGGNGGDRRNGGAKGVGRQNKPAPVGGLSEDDRKKAEERKKRFG